MKLLVLLLTLLIPTVANAIVFYAPPPSGADCFEAAGTGFVAKLNECILTGTHVAVADPLSPTGFSVNITNITKKGEISAPGSIIDCDPCYVWANYKSEVEKPGGWIDDAPLGPTPSNAALGFSLPVQTSGAWQPLFQAGSAINFKNGVSSVDRVTFSAPDVLNVRGRNGVHLMCLYVDENPDASPPANCEPAGDPAPTAHFAVKLCTAGGTCPTSPTSAVWEQANSWTILGNNTTGETGHALRVLRDTEFLHYQFTIPDATLTTTACGNDNGSCITSGNDRMEILLRDNTSNVDPRDAQSLKLVANLKTTPDKFDANYPGGVATTAYDSTMTAACDTTISPRKCYIKHRFASRTFVDNEMIRMNWMVSNTGIGQIHGFTGSLINSHSDDPLILLSSEAVSGVDSTPPVVGNTNCNNSVTASSMICTATTDDNGTPRVIYGLASAPGTYPNTVINGTCVAGVCSVTLSSLTASTNYCAKVQVSDSAGNLGTSGAEDCQATSAPSTGTHFASPGGGGTCLSSGSRGTIQQCLQLLTAGSTLILGDGTYTGTTGMIVPPGGRSGTQANRITVQAENDGKVLIDGQGQRQPVRLGNNNDWWVLKGFNVANGGGSNPSTLQIDGGSDNNLVQRVVAWNCPVTANCTIMTMNGGVNNTLEDVAAFGTGRKIFSGSQSGISNWRIRRAWGAWTRTENTVNAPKMVYSLAYNSRNVIYENVIGTWHEESPATNAGGSRFGILAMDGIDPPDECANSVYYGSIAYMRGTDQKKENLLGLFENSSSVICTRFEHSVNYVEPGTHSGQRSLALNNLGTSRGGPLSQAEAQKFVHRSTSIGGDGTDSVGSEWQITSSENVATVGAASNIWNGASAQGARVCKRYLNGVLTSEPLWPWPMQDRINAALTASGRNPADYFRGSGNTVTSEMETIFGAIPAECRSS